MGKNARGLDAKTELPSGNWTWAQPRLQARISHLRSLLTDRTTHDVEIRQELHRLAGTLGCFGLIECSKLTRTIESRMTNGEALQKILLRLDKLQTQLASPKTAHSNQLVASVALICQLDCPVLDLIALGFSRNISIAPIESLSGLVGKNWDAVVLDTLHPSAESFPPELNLPVLGLVCGDDLSSHSCALNAGATVTCHRKEAPKVIFQVLNQMLEQSEFRSRRVLVVDDDPVLLSSLKQIMSEAGYLVEIARSPSEFWRALEVFSPDLLIIDLVLPEYSGADLCKFIRADYRWRDLPVLFLSASTDRDTIIQLYEAGADDFLTKPVDKELLLRRLAGHWRRKESHQTNLLDELTTLPNRKLATRELERLLSLARRQGCALTLTLIDLDHFKAINDKHGHNLGDQVLAKMGQVLKSTFRNEDIVGRWGGEEFVIGQLNCTGRQAAERLTKLIGEFSKIEFASSSGSFHVTFSAGIAVFSGTQENLGMLYRQADTALYKAKEQGRARVILSPGSSPPRMLEARNDIVLLEDDNELGELLIRAFRARGFTAIRYRDGLQALSAWLSEEFYPPKVLIVDNALPGLTGLEFLRRVAKDTSLSGTRVVTMSEYMEGFEVLESASLGAWDHIPKPFSLSLLISTVERYLHSVQEDRT